MPRLLLTTCLLLLVGHCVAQSPRHNLLKSLDKQRFTAQIQKDSLTLNRLMADDLLYTHSSGVVETKKQFIHSVASGRWNYQAIEADSVTVRFYGPVAILTGRARVTLLVNSQPTTVIMVYTDVWHEQPAARGAASPRWQLVSWGASRLPNP
jgi:hypothetical protein